MATRKTIKVVTGEPEHICKECKHVYMKRGEGLYCHRYPPVFVFDYQSGASAVQWPEIAPTDFCGEFAPPLNS